MENCELRVGEHAVEELIAEAENYWKEGSSESALELLNDPLLAENCTAIFLAGEIHYNNQNWGKALNCFRKCLQLNPGLSAAQTYVDLILNILGFFHTDQFNP